MKKIKAFLMLTNIFLLTQMCNKNINKLNYKIKGVELNKTILSHIIRGEEKELIDFLKQNPTIDLMKTTRD